MHPILWHAVAIVLTVYILFAVCTPFKQTFNFQLLYFGLLAPVVLCTVLANINIG